MTFDQKIHLHVRMQSCILMNTCAWQHSNQWRRKRYRLTGILSYALGGVWWRDFPFKYMMVYKGTRETLLVSKIKRNTAWQYLDHTGEGRQGTLTELGLRG